MKLKEGSLLQRVARLTSQKADDEETFKRNVMIIAEFFHISPASVLDMPRGVYVECISYINERKNPKPLGKKHMGGINAYQRR